MTLQEYWDHRWERHRQLKAALARRTRRIGVAKADILSPSRQQHLVEVRRKFAIDARRVGYTCVEIGAALHRDHSTVKHYWGSL